MKKRKHRGVTLVPDNDGNVFLVELAPHYKDECKEKCEKARQQVCGHETVFESSDAGEARRSVGYSKNYAVNFDKAFAKN